jgi:uncharacterized protein YbbC (DUF1343 family)
MHGVTAGELARLFSAERNMKADLMVIEVVGWKRSMWYDETLLTWVSPSPDPRNEDRS